MPDKLKQLLTGAGLGVLSALFVWGATSAEWSFLKEMVDGYEFRSYDSRFKSYTANSTEAAIDTVVVVDIEQESIDAYGNYYRWYHWLHADLINYLASGGARAVLFDIIIDSEPEPANDTAFVAATWRSNNTYHALVLSPTDSLNFRYAMAAPPDGVHLYVTPTPTSLAQVSTRFFGTPEAAAYLRSINTDLLPSSDALPAGQIVRIPVQLDVASHALTIPTEIAERLPSGERFDNTFIDLLNASRGIGSANFPNDPDGVIRRSPTAIYFSSAGLVFPSLTMAAVMDILDIPPDGLEYDFDKRVLRLVNRDGQVVREAPIDKQGRVWINYQGTWRTFRTVPYAWANPEMLPAEYFRGKVVLVGASLPGLMDLRSTPMQEAYPGVEVHANVIHSFLTGEFVRPVSKTSMFWIVLILGLLLGGILGLVGAGPSGLVLGGVAGLVLGGIAGLVLGGFAGLVLGAIIGSVLGFVLGRFKFIVLLLVILAVSAGWMLFVFARFLDNLAVFEMVRPVISFGGVFLSVSLFQFLVLEKDKRFLRKTFSTYVSPELIEEMVEAKCEPQLGGDSGLRTAYFTDIQSFSSFSEILTATQLVALLNEYLTSLTDILLNKGGTLDKFEGDAIVAFFGAPLPLEDHAARALHTALSMQATLAGLREKWRSEGDKWPQPVHEMRMRIGIHSGEFVTGNMGTDTRMNYTMMGDVVNTAARLEASAKQYGIYIQCTRKSLELAGPDAFEWRDIDKVRVVGKSEAVETVEIMARNGGLDGSLLEMRDRYQEGMDLYRQQQWDRARKTFEQSERLEEAFPKRPTTPSRVYIQRCDHFEANPPGDDWDGSWTLTSK